MKLDVVKNSKYVWDVSGNEVTVVAGPDQEGACALETSEGRIHLGFADELSDIPKTTVPTGWIHVYANGATSDVMDPADPDVRGVVATIHVADAEWEPGVPYAYLSKNMS